MIVVTTAAVRRLALLAVLPAVVAGSVLVSSTEVAAASGANLVRNGSFEKNLSGWRHTSGTSVSVRRVKAGPVGARAVKLTPKRRTTIVLDDRRPIISSSARGSRYTVTAWVRTTKPTVRGSVVLRERGKGRAIAHRKSFRLKDRRWHKVTFGARLTRSGAKVDLVVKAKVRRKQALMVDGVAVTATRTSSTSARACGRRSVDSRGVPSCGALVGATVGSNSDPTRFESQVGGRLGVRRTFWRPDQVGSAVQTARADLAAGRQPWISFKTPYSWEKMVAGRGDAWARDLARQLKSAGGPVWVAVHHEPEGDGDIKAWTAMQRRLAPIVRSGAPNVAYSIILTGWNQVYGPAAYRLNALWPAGTKIDIAGFDVYNLYGTVKNRKTEKRHMDMRADYFEPISRWARAKGIAWGLAETGYTDAAHRVDPTWLSRTYRELNSTGGIAMAYFNTTLNSQGASWVLDASKRRSFAGVLRSAPRPR